MPWFAGQHAGAGAQEGHGWYGPNDFEAAGVQVGLSHNELLGLTQSAYSITPQGLTNRQPQTSSAAGTHRHDQSLHPPPQAVYQVPRIPGSLSHGIHCSICLTNSKGTHPVQHQHPPSHTHPQAFLPLHSHSHSHSHSQALPQAAPAVGGSRAPRPFDAHSAWHQLRFQHSSWDPDLREPIGHDGESVLMSFAARGDGRIHCRVPTDKGLCNYSSVKKERLLHHIRRDHLAFLPFACNGGCGASGWCVPLCFS
jgi:hypothetical protein